MKFEIDQGNYLPC